jgi:hypothetical protein
MNKTVLQYSISQYTRNSETSFIYFKIVKKSTQEPHWYVLKLKKKMDSEAPFYYYLWELQFIQGK